MRAPGRLLRRLTTLPLLVALVALAAGGCGRGDGGGQGNGAPSGASATASVAASVAASSDSVVRAPAADGPIAPATDACPKSGAWTRCNLEDRLTHAGFVFTLRPDTVRHDFLSVAGFAYEMARGEVQVFFYPDAAARERDTGALDPETVSPRGTRISWPAPPRLVTSNNLAAVILSQNPRLIERLQLALGAGLPNGDGQ